VFVNVRAIIEKEVNGVTEIMIQKRNKPHENETSFELPGGRLEEYESMIDGLKREVLEETGLIVTEIEGIHSKIDTDGDHTNVECMKPFAVYQTTKGPVDSMGVYFRCKAEGNLLTQGDDTEDLQWISVHQLNEWIIRDVEQFSWVDRAGILFYLRLC
jgi:8-oxo-dGTP diphosphatase